MCDYQINHRKLVTLEDAVTSLDPEQLGTKEKGWLDDECHLFKRGRLGTGEDWAEVVASALCSLMGIPHAAYCFARDKNQNAGVLTKSIVPETGRLIHGNELMSIYKDYDPSKKYKLKEHKLRRVYALLLFLHKEHNLPSNGIIFEPPLSSLNKEVSPLFYFASYLMLDALIGNQDRHHENWGFILYNKKLYLAETYDHASSLGRNDSDKKKLSIINRQDARFGIPEYCSRAITPFYSSTAIPKKLKTFEAFKDFINLAGINKDDLLNYLEPITEGDIMKIFLELPKVPNGPSEISARFACAMIMENKRKLIEET